MRGEGAKVAMVERTQGFAVPHLTEWRMRRFMKQSELAETAGVSLLTVSRAERGMRMSYDSVRKLAAALGITTDDLRFRDPPSA